MKNLISTFAIAMTISALTFQPTMATSIKTSATIAVGSKLSSGTYPGLNQSGKCLVHVKIESSSVTMTIEDQTQSRSTSDTFVVLNSDSYSAKVGPLKLTASRKLGYPRYLNGGTKFLIVEEKENAEVDVTILNSLLDHKGQDAGSLTTCTIL